MLSFFNGSVYFNFCLMCLISLLSKLVSSRNLTLNITDLRLSTKNTGINKLVTKSRRWTLLSLLVLIELSNSKIFSRGYWPFFFIDDFTYGIQKQILLYIFVCYVPRSLSDRFHNLVLKTFDDLLDRVLRSAPYLTSIGLH